MNKLDIKLSYYYYDLADNTAIHLTFTPAASELQQVSAGFIDTINFNPTPDHLNGIYTSMQDYIDTWYPAYSSSMLTQVNGFLNDTYELGDLVYVEQHVDDEVQTKQDKNTNLTALSSATLASNKMLYATGSTSFGSFDTTSFGRGLLNTADQAALQTAVGVSAVGKTGAYSDLTGKPSFATVATSGSYADLTSKPSIPSVYSGTNLKSNPILYASSATVASGVAVFQLTSDGTSSGTALFPSGPITTSLNCFVSDSAASYQMAGVWSNSNKTLTVTTNKLGTANILTGILGQVAGNGAVVNVQVWGN